jgi:amino acid adenylation domain-containing protein
MEISKVTSLSGCELSEGKLATFCVPELVRQQAALTPDGLAVCAGSEILTYGELEGRANRMANYLRNLGVVPGEVVAVCLERSVDFPVVALAILKAAGVYLPLEPNTPAKRLQTMLKAAQVSVVVTRSNKLRSLTGDGRTLVALDEHAAEINRCSSQTPDIAVAPEQLAYAIFTSGSTGAPKAVAVGHDNLLNLCHWHNRAFAVDAQDRGTLLASIGFDAAVWELWPYLISGASVHVVSDELRSHPEELRNWLVKESITISFAPTPLAEHMLELPWPENTALRFLLTGADTLRHFAPSDLPFTLINNYGPTECTVVATSGAVPTQRGEQLPSIGRPIDNTEIYILDDQMRPVAGEEVGEIFVGGAGLAKGYLNDPALTSERFVKHPFSTIPSGKLYRTGDMGQWLPDGQIAFHGRFDDQVKIRGHRVELNEVNDVLKRHSAVRESVITAGGNGTGEKHLAAYVVPIAEFPQVTELRDFMALELPDYMLPAKFVRLDALPVAPSGKVDRSALPVPNDENTVREQDFLSPDTITEQRVAKIVASLLRLQLVGAEDNFFYLGGNSLFGTQLISRLRDAFGVEVPLLRLFDHPTVIDLAGEVERLMIEKVDAMTEEEAQHLLALNTEQAGL